MTRCSAKRCVLVALMLSSMLLAPSAEAQSSVPACVDRSDAPPLLERYEALSIAGARYRLRLRWDGRAWLPHPSLSMPMHHASALAYVDFTFPDSHEDLELEIEAVERVFVRRDERYHTFFFEYRVRVLQVCTRVASP